MSGDAAHLPEAMRRQAWRQVREAYGWHTPLTPRHADLDLLRHLNNAAAIGLHIEARIRWLDAVLPQPAAEGLRLRPAGLWTDFLAEGGYPAPLEAGVALLCVDAEAAHIATALFQQGRCIGLQHAELAAWQDGERVPLPAALVQRLRAHEQPHPLPTEVHAAFGTASSRSVDEALATRYADLDADGLLSDLALARYLEHGRSRWWLDGGTDPSRLPLVGGVDVMVAHIAMRVHRAAPVPGTWQLRTGVQAMGRSSVTMRCRLSDGARLQADSEAVLVAIDPASHRPAPLPDAVRERWSALLPAA